MTTFSTTIKTEHAQKYLQQLCKHFAHKVAVQYSPQEGRVAFPPGRCLMQADSETLKLFCNAEAEPGVSVIKAIIDDHIVRFAWREELRYEWLEGVPEQSHDVLASTDFLPESALSQNGGAS